MREAKSYKVIRLSRLLMQLCGLGYLRVPVGGLYREYYIRRCLETLPVDNILYQPIYKNFGEFYSQLLWSENAINTLYNKG